MRSTYPSRFPSHPARRATILLSVQDRARHRSLMVEPLRRAKHAKMAGATVYEAHEGYAESGRIHRVHLMLDDRPVAVVIVDQPEKVDAFLDEVADLLDDVVVVVDDIEIVGT